MVEDTRACDATPLETTEEVRASLAPEPQKTVLLGITGCIAAYKACEITRALQKAGVRVRVMMTENAQRFVGPATYEALTQEPVVSTLFSNEGNPIPHIAGAQDCDLCLIAPCTANVMAKIAHGIADDLVTSTVLACTKPLVIAPAMNVHMYENAATQANMQLLAQRGVHFIEPSEGMLACGEVGKGHLADEHEIAARVLALLNGHQDKPQDEAVAVEATIVSDAPSAHHDTATENVLNLPPQDFVGKHVLITAGPTREPLDDVRFISNRSSGKMGYALAAAAAARGAQVTLVSGPVALSAPEGVTVVHVETADEMLAACEQAFKGSDITVCTAAVADMKPAHRIEGKLKKGIDDLSTVELVENPDILATLGAKKSVNQVVIGFAAETHDVVGLAKSKLTTKHADLIVANCVAQGAVFGADTNTVTLVSEESDIEYPEMPKSAVADTILNTALEILFVKG